MSGADGGRAGLWSSVGSADMERSRHAGHRRNPPSPRSRRVPDRPGWPPRAGRRFHYHSLFWDRSQEMLRNR